MSTYDNLPPYLREFYANYGGSTEQMKAAHIADHFDDPVEPILEKQIDFLLKVYERLIHVTISRKATEGRNGELYHRILTYPDRLIYWNQGTKEC